MRNQSLTSDLDGLGFNMPAHAAFNNPALNLSGVKKNDAAVNLCYS